MMIRRAAQWLRNRAWYGQADRVILTAILEQGAATHRAVRRLEDAVSALSATVEKIMPTLDEELAKVNAANTMLDGIAATLTTLAAGHNTIAAEIADLKAQIAAGTPPDFSALDAALNDQATKINSVGGLIVANTPTPAPAPAPAAPAVDASGNAAPVVVAPAS